VLATYYTHFYLIISLFALLIMASQASSVLSSIPDQNWSDIEPLFRPLLSSPPVPSSQACSNTGEAAEDNDTPEKIAQKRTSEVWEHSFYSRHKITLDKQGRSIWRCKYCTQVYVDSGGTGNALRHLKKHHGRQIQNQNEKRIDRYQGHINMAEFRAQSAVANSKRRRYDGGYVEAEEDDDGRGPGRELDPAVLEQLYVEWISTCGVAFEMVEKDEFRA
jgi:ribosomal protein L37AE/L43A